MLEQVGIGQLRMTVDELYDLTPRQFANAQKGFFDLIQSKEREEWERQRFFTTALINVQLPKNSKIKTTELISFDWDKKSKPIQLTDEQLKQWING
jgi:hypothetical protein